MVGLPDGSVGRFYKDLLCGSIVTDEVFTNFKRSRLVSSCILASLFSPVDRAEKARLRSFNFEQY